MLHLRKKDKKQDEQVIFIQVAFFAVGAVLLLWYLAPWVLNRILNAGNVLGIAFAVVLLLCGMFAQPVTHWLAPGNHVVAGLVKFDLVPVDLAVGGDHLFEQGDVAGFEAVHGADQLLFHEAAHRQHARAQALEIGIELSADVFLIHAIT